CRSMPPFCRSLPILRAWISMGCAVNGAPTWAAKGLLDRVGASTLTFGDRNLTVVEGGPGRMLSNLASCRSPNSKTEALAFGMAMKASRLLDPESTLEDGIYVERLSRILPTRGPKRDWTTGRSWEP